MGLLLFMLELIENSLKMRNPRKLPVEDLVPAAVLVPLFSKEGKLHLLMERRTDRVEKHRGQISFPGGVQDPQDKDSVATALRESYEEVGLEPKDAKILGFLSDTRTVTGFLVTPVVAWIPYPYPFKTSVEEVAELLEVPWVVFSEGWGHKITQTEYDDQIHEVHFYQYENHTIWGATARITRELLQLVEACRKPLEGA